MRGGLNCANLYSTAKPFDENLKKHITSPRVATVNDSEPMAVDTVEKRERERRKGNGMRPCKHCKQASSGPPLICLHFLPTLLFLLLLLLRGLRAREVGVVQLLIVMAWSNKSVSFIAFAAIVTLVSPCHKRFLFSSLL